MDSHLLVGKNNLNNLSTTVLAVYTFIVVASLASRSVSATTAGNVLKTRRNSRFADVDREGGQVLIGDELKISIDISGIRPRPQDPEMAHDLSKEGDTVVSSTSSDNILMMVSPRRGRRLTTEEGSTTHVSSPGINTPPSSTEPDPGQG